MKINKIELIRLELPLKKILKTSFGSINNRETIIVKLQTDKGIIGFGESPLLKFPISEPETIDIGIKTIKNKISPLILNRDFGTINSFKKILDKFPNNPITKIGLEGAFMSILSEENSKYIGEIFGNFKMRDLEAIETISISNNNDSILSEVKKFVDAGYKNLKIKIMPGHDIKIIQLIQKNFRETKFSVDANASYKYNYKHINILKELDNYNLLYIEQPFEASLLKEHAALQAQIKTPICLDESIKSLKTAKKAIKLKSCKIINIKPARIGSYIESKQIHDLCLKNNINLFIGGRLESGIGKAFNLVLGNLPGCALPFDNSSSLEYFNDDIIKPRFKINKGYVTQPNTKKTIGFQIDINKINKYKIDTIAIQ